MAKKKTIFPSLFLVIRTATLHLHSLKSQQEILQLCITKGQLQNLEVGLSTGRAESGLCPTRTRPQWIRVGKSLTHNQLGSSFRSVGSGRIGFESISVGFGFARVEQNLAGFWLKYCRISSDLVGSNKIQLIFPYIYKYRAKILMDLAEIYLSDRLKGFDLPVFGRVCDFRRGKNSSLGGSGLLVSQIANPQLESMVSSACAGDSRPTVTKL